MAYNSKYTGAEVDALLDKIKDDDVGDIDSSLSTTSEYPVMNKVITTELNKKATKTEVSSLSTTVTENKTATDTALSDLSAEVDEEVEALQSQLDSDGVLIEDLQESKADVSGYYPELHVGLSDNLPDRGDIVEGAIGFRASAGEGNSIEDGVANVKELLGDSVVWNQLVNFDNSSYSTGGITITSEVGNTLILNGTATGSSSNSLYQTTIHLIGSHKYLYGSTKALNTGDYWRLYGLETTNINGGNSLSILSASSSSDYYVTFVFLSGTTYENAKYDIQLIDLTLMFGAGNEPSTIEEFNAFCNQLVGVDLNAYNEGEVLGVHAKGFKSVNDNAWDEEWELGSITNIVSTNRIRSKNLIKVIAGEKYFFGCTGAGSYLEVAEYDSDKNYLRKYGVYYNREKELSQDAYYIEIGTDNSYGTTYNNDICIRLAHSGYKTDYVTHEESEVSFDLSEYFPYGMHGIGEVRDSATPSKATRRFGRVDLGTLNWVGSSAEGFENSFWAKNQLADKAAGSNLTTIYSITNANGWIIASKADKAICGSTNVGYEKDIWVRDSAYTDAATFKAAMNGVYLVYELAEPIETEIDPMKNFSYEVWDFGTEEMLSDVPSMPVTTRTIYGFNATDTIRGNKAKNKEQDERLTDLENEVVRVGDYQPDLSVGVADQLAGHEDATPSEIGFRRSGGGAILDGNARIESIKGNSVVWNQLTKSENFAATAADVTNDGQKFTVVPTGVSPGIADPVTRPIPIVGHKYILLCEKSGGTRAIYINWGGYNASLPTTSIFSATDSSKLVLTIFSYNETETFTLTIPKLIDLTKMFGAGNEPTTIEEFYARCPLGVDMNAYNEGEVIHMDADAIKSVGVNQWDEEWENFVIESSGNIFVDTTRIGSKNYIPIIPHNQYYVTGGRISFAEYDADKNFIAIGDNGSFSGPNALLPISQNARYIKFFTAAAYGATYNHDICINISDTEVNGEYFPYIKREQSLDIIGKYFPQGMKSAGTAHDEIRYNKTTQKWEAVKRIGEVDMGTLRWDRQTDVGEGYFRAVIVGMAINYNQLCAQYTHVNHIRWELVDKSIAIYNTTENRICVMDSAYTDVTTFKTAMSGVMLYYELAEPIVTEIDENINLDYEVWNVGTEQAIAEAPSTPLKVDIIYGFNAYGVIKELLARVASLEEANASLASQLASVTSHNEEV